MNYNKLFSICDILTNYILQDEERLEIGEVTCSKILSSNNQSTSNEYNDHNDE